MFDFLAFRTFYIRLKSDWLSVRLVSRNRQPYEYENIPCIAIKLTGTTNAFGSLKSNQILAVGQEAIELQKYQESNILLLNGFEHPRTIISNFFVAELTLKHFVEKTGQERTSLISPKLIIHPLEKLEGGLTQIETRALLELGMQVGAREVYLYCEENSLSDEEILTIHTNEKVIKGSIFLKS